MQINVVHWLSDKLQKEYTLNGWEDDFIQTLYSRIIYGLKLSSSRIYVWTGKKSLGISINTKWTNWDVNPFKSLPFQSEAPSCTIKTQLKELLCQYARKCNQLYINVVEESAFTNVTSNFLNHYFSNWHLQLEDRLVRQDELIKSLINVSTDKVGIETISYKYISIIAELEKSVLLSELFEKATVSKDIPLVQCMLDMSHNVYKLYQKHTISEDILQLWFSQIPKTACFVAYIQWTDDIYGRLVCDKNGHIEWIGRIDVRTSFDKSAVHKRIHGCELWCNKLFNKKIKFKPFLLSARVDLRTSNPSLAGLADICSRFPLIFTIQSLESHQLILQAKRVSTSTTYDNPFDYIKSRLNLGILQTDVIREIQGLYGLTESQAIQEMTDAQTNVKQELQKKRKIKQPVLTINCTLTGVGIRVVLEQANSWRDIERTVDYLHHCMAIWETAKGKQTKLPTAILSSSSSSEEQIISSSSSSEKGLEKSFSLSSSSSSGGAGIFIDELQKADPQLFRYPRYARDCGAPRQPIAISDEDLANINPKSYDSIIKAFGSDEAHKNNYICPRIWCPKSRIALTDKELTDLNGKCPGPYFETPAKLYEYSYWNNDPSQPHHVGFIHSKDDPNICLPCCFKDYRQKRIDECTAKPEKKPSSKETESKEKKSKNPVPQQDTYLFTITTPAPIEANRWGVIPKVLHDAYTPQITYEMCTKSLSMMHCLVRRGILHKDDSLMNAIAITLGYEDKASLMKFLKTILNPFIFIQLQGGKLLKYFLKDTEPIEQRSFVKRRSIAKRLTKWKDYIKQFELEDVIHLLENSDVIHSTLQTLLWKVSRQVVILDAYQRFWDMLESNESKNPQWLFDALWRCNIVMMIWEKDSEGHVRLQCPMIPDPHQLDALQQRNDMKVILLLKDGDYYEPLEWKSRSGPGVLSMTRALTAPFISQSALYLGKCPGIEVRPKWLNTILYLNNWTKYFLTYPSDFKVQSIILSPTMRIVALWLKGGAWITLPDNGTSIHYLQDFVKSYKNVTVIYHEDISGHIKNIRLFKEDIEILAGKVVKLKCGLDIGKQIKNEDFYYNTIFTVPLVTYEEEGPWIRVHEEDIHSINTSKVDLRKRAVIKTITLHYDRFASILEHKKEHSLQIKELTDLIHKYVQWKDIPDSQLTEIVEWLAYNSPWTNQKLMTSLALLGTHTRLPWYSNEVKNVKNAWIFSQNAVESGLPMIKKQIAPSITVIAKKTEIINEKANEKDETELFKQCKWEVMPNNWTKFRASSWTQYQMCHPPNITYINNIFEEMAIKINHVWNNEEIIAIVKKHVRKLWSYNFDELITLLNEDNELFKEWNKQLNVNRKKAEDLVEKNLRTMTLYQWNTFISNWNPSINELYIYYVSKLFKINIFVIYERIRKYGSAQGVKRGDIQYLSLSSAFYNCSADWKKYPIFFMHKWEPNLYGPIIHNSGRLLHYYKNLEKDICDLINVHAQKM